jgi:hypothetical protein
MKKFKDFILEDIWQLSQSVERLPQGEVPKQLGFSPSDFGDPIHSIGDYDVHQLHHGSGQHRGYGRFVNTDQQIFSGRHVYDGGMFLLKHRPTGEVAGYLRYRHNPEIPNEIHVNDLLGYQGHRGVRDMLYDTASDKLGYSIVSDWSQTKKGVRGWKSDIENGKNVKIRVVDPSDDDRIIAEHPAKGIPSENIWTEHDPEVGESILLVRHPK